MPDLHALIDVLPDELLLSVMCFLTDERDLKQVALLCRRMQGVTNECAIWMNLIEHKWPGVAGMKLAQGLICEMGAQKAFFHLKTNLPCVPKAYENREITVHEDGRAVTFESNRFGKAGTIHPTVPVPVLFTAYYFEATLLDEGVDCNVGIGLYAAEKPVFDERMVGWDQNGVGYHGDDGKKRRQPVGEAYGPKWKRGDVVGCGWNRDSGDVFFTLNGVSLGTAYTVENSDKKFYPVITAVYLNHAIEKASYTVSVNYGERPFVYNQPIPVSHTVNRKAEATAALARLSSGGSFGSTPAPFDKRSSGGSFNKLSSGSFGNKRDAYQLVGLHLSTHVLAQ